MNGTRQSIVAATFLTIFCCGPSAPAATIGVIGNVSWQPTPGGGPATRRNGTNLTVDKFANPIVRIDLAVTSSQGDHQGVSQVVYDLRSPAASAQALFFDYINPEGNTGAYRPYSGYSNFDGPPAPQTTMAPAYTTPQPSFPPANYSGGWGWTNSGLPHQGNTAIPGRVSGAGDSLPLTWSGDLNPSIPGIQSYARIGIGLGANVAPDDDPILGGQTLGFGTDVPNGVAGGGGEWWFASILVDLTDWHMQTYTFNVTTTAGNVLGSGADLSQPLGGAFRQAVIGDDLHGTSFSITIVPEPAAMLILLGALGLVRRR